MRTMTLTLFCAALLILQACGDSAPGTDAGLEDAGLEDAGLEDAGLEDAGTEDAGTEDAGIEDAGTEDAGTEDAGIEDAGTEDAGVEDAGVEDAGTEDAGTEDAGGEDAGGEDAGADEDPGPTNHILGYACVEGDQGRPKGGGEGYDAWLASSGDNTTFVQTKAELLQALALATPGEIVYVDDNAVIDLSLERDHQIEITDGVTLASGRGRGGSLGALLYTEDHDTQVYAARALFVITGSEARVTGLRIRGPDQEVGETYDSPLAVGIRTPYSTTIDHTVVEIDNCELFGWTIGAVEIGGTDRAMVHHNYFHHNRRAGLGYGVVLSYAYPIIGANIFDHNRHAIASTGYPTSSYEACHNLVLAHATSFGFDMHGGFDKGFYPDTAGSTILIHDNIFLAAGVDGVGIRGVPDTEARIDNNRFVHNSSHAFPSAIWQRLWPEAPDCLYTGGCVLSDWAGHPGYLWMEDRDTCRDACSPYIKLRDPSGLVDISCSGNSFGQAHLPAWFASFGGSTYWQFRDFASIAPQNMLFGDLDGDGRQDGFVASGGTWYLYPGLKLPAQTINSSSAPQADLGLADFDGDGQADVFYADGSTWRVSWSGTSGWANLNTSTLPQASVHLADFNGDGQADVFRANGSDWRVVWSGSNAWQILNSMTEPLSELLFGDFDGDGATDVFHANGSNWRVSWSGSSAWTNINTSGITEVAVADLNGDGQADIFRANGTSWTVSWSGSSGWQTLQNLPETMDTLRFADVNGDGTDDILSLR